MIRKAIALLLFLILGLYAPVVALPLCLCGGNQPAVQDDGCCEEEPCSTETEAERTPCCSDPECCIVLTGMPDGMEPQVSATPVPVPAPVLIALSDALDASLAQAGDPRPRMADPPPPAEACARIAFGVWRL
ncbi:MAG: hypothetical protein AAGB14_00805 [Verrucomicrobiota bacterium]